MGTNGSTMLQPLRQGLPPLDPAAVSDAVSCSFPARHEAVREARKFTQKTCTQWDTGNRFDDVRLVVSELVTNALRHGLPVGTPRSAEQVAPVRLHLMRCTGRLVCAVRDPSYGSPVTNPVDNASAESGRGLLLVEAFSDGWGWQPMRGGRGKVVWALFLLRPPGGE